MSACSIELDLPRVRGLAGDRALKWINSFSTQRRWAPVRAIGKWREEVCVRPKEERRLTCLEYDASSTPCSELVLNHLHCQSKRKRTALSIGYARFPIQPL